MPTKKRTAENLPTSRKLKKVGRRAGIYGSIEKKFQALTSSFKVLFGAGEIQKVFDKIIYQWIESKELKVTCFRSEKTKDEAIVRAIRTIRAFQMDIECQCLIFRTDANVTEIVDNVLRPMCKWLQPDDGDGFHSGCSDGVKSEHADKEREVNDIGEEGNMVNRISTKAKTTGENTMEDELDSGNETDIHNRVECRGRENIRREIGEMEIMTEMKSVADIENGRDIALNQQNRADLYNVSVSGTGKAMSRKTEVETITRKFVLGHVNANKRFDTLDNMEGQDKHAVQNLVGFTNMKTGSVDMRATEFGLDEGDRDDISASNISEGCKRRKSDRCKSGNERLRKRPRVTGITDLDDTPKRKYQKKSQENCKQGKSKNDRQSDKGEINDDDDVPILNLFLKPKNSQNDHKHNSYTRASNADIHKQSRRRTLEKRDDSNDKGKGNNVNVSTELCANKKSSMSRSTRRHQLPSRSVSKHVECTLKRHRYRRQSQPPSRPQLRSQLRSASQNQGVNMNKIPTSKRRTITTRSRNRKMIVGKIINDEDHEAGISNQTGNTLRRTRRKTKMPMTEKIKTSAPSSARLNSGRVTRMRMNRKAKKEHPPLLLSLRIRPTRSPSHSAPRHEGDVNEMRPNTEEENTTEGSTSTYTTPKYPSELQQGKRQTDRMRLNLIYTRTSENDTNGSPLSAATITSPSPSPSSPPSSPPPLPPLPVIRVNRSALNKANLLVAVAEEIVLSYTHSERTKRDIHHIFSSIRHSSTRLTRLDSLCVPYEFVPIAAKVLKSCGIGTINGRVGWPVEGRLKIGERDMADIVKNVWPASVSDMVHKVCPGEKFWDNVFPKAKLVDQQREGRMGRVKVGGMLSSCLVIAGVLEVCGLSMSTEAIWCGECGKRSDGLGKCLIMFDERDVRRGMRWAGEAATECHSKSLFYA